MSIGEIVRIAAIDTVLGMGTVFSVLILISIVIWLLGFLKDGDKKKAADSPAPAPVRSAAVPEPAAGDDALIAVIMAAIKAYNESEDSSEDSDEYIVRSIRRATWKRT